MFDLESLIGHTHPARSIWAFLEGMDLTRFYAGIKTTEATVGRSPTDPKILLALWLYAHTDGVGSARGIDRLCRTDDAYRWICGGVEMNYHTLSDFRVDHGEALDDLLTQMLAVLLHQGLVELAEVAQDGMRVRADAGAASFRRRGTLEEHLVVARKQVEQLRQELEEDSSRRQRMEDAARERAARERVEALERAMAELAEIEETKRRQREQGKDVSEPRASTTDPDARVMKMADGGFRPAYNVQLATDTDSRFIVGVMVTNQGADQGQLVPMLDDILRRTGMVPGAYLVDGGYRSLPQITEATRRGATIYAPLAKPRRRRRCSGPPPALRGGPEVQSWRRRMERPEAKATYRRRAATAETTNADLRCRRGMDRFQVRGLRKARCQALLGVLAYNIRRWVALTN